MNYLFVCSPNPRTYPCDGKVRGTHQAPAPSTPIPFARAYTLCEAAERSPLLQYSTERPRRYSPKQKTERLPHASFTLTGAGLPAVPLYP